MKLEELQKITRELSQADIMGDREKVNAVFASLGLQPGNCYQGLEMTSNYVDTHQDVSFSNAHMELHSHEFYEILYCRQVENVEYLVGHERYRLQAGDVIVVPPGVAHRPLLPENMTQPYRRDVLWISKLFVRRLQSFAANNSTEELDMFGLLRAAGTQWEFLGELFSLGVRESETRRDGWDAVVMGNAIVIMTNLKRAFGENGRDRKLRVKTELLDRVMAHIEVNYTHRITLEDTAKKFYLSESTVSHLFRQKLGVSFYRFVMQRRLIAAKTLIQQKIPMEQVAFQVGFADYSAFYRAFKKEYGISPRQFGQRYGL